MLVKGYWIFINQWYKMIIQENYKRKLISSQFDLRELLIFYEICVGISGTTFKIGIVKENIRFNESFQWTKFIIFYLYWYVYFFLNQCNYMLLLLHLFNIKSDLMSYNYREDIIIFCDYFAIVTVAMTNKYKNKQWDKHLTKQHSIMCNAIVICSILSI